MRTTLTRAAVFIALIGSVLCVTAGATAPSAGFAAASVHVTSALVDAQGQQPSSTDAPTGPTPAPTGTATPAESSPPPPGGPSDAGTAQANDTTPLLIGVAIILVILFVAFYLWRRRGAVRDL
ncbi:hypothetical protein [Pseudarthrobacter sp. NamB4]|uniref:hypothetical protein n=1 Tax=Pseudarthrobacter sp. NamB4 TaxID=2576837 RepID=UPI0010FD9E17|nr:hypothetical protein [Pseudarthrobacter sp. NamB4]TLM70706.1 hypothetical protein FDW81_17220 [Pseudarthrobacter sp. NamB4]